MRIEVKQDHIDRGQRKMKCNCPVALAVIDSVRDNLIVKVNYDNMIVGNRSFYMSERTRTFIRRFDDGEAVEPFAFNLTDMTLDWRRIKRK